MCETTMEHMPLKPMSSKSQRLKGERGREAVRELRTESRVTQNQAETWGITEEERPRGGNGVYESK